MALADLNLEVGDDPVPANVRAFLREADRRVDHIGRNAHLPAFVPSDYAGAYRVLRALAESDLTRGPLFCEWGSGLGVTACLAALVGFEACGIEVEEELVEAARRLADDFDLPVEFVRGSFIPEGGEALLERVGGLSWLATDEGSAHHELGLGPDDFDVIFVYPWPDEEGVTEALFGRYAGEGAVLVSYHTDGPFRLRRKCRGP
jgi:hypothetical protein